MIHLANPRNLARASVLLGAVLLFVACSSAKRDDSGQIVEGGDLDVFTIKVGDCFQDSDADEVEDVAAVPCSQPHDNEVYHTFLMSNGKWPGEEAVEQTADERCLPAFEKYVGSTYEESRLDYSWLTPTKRSWEEKDDREIVCILYDAEFERLTGSMKGSRE